MKSLLIAVAAFGMLVIAGCATGQFACPCTEAEICKLKAKQPVQLCKCGEIKGSPKCCDKSIPYSQKTGFHEDSIRDRLLTNSQALNLTKDEQSILRKKKTVIICGCGNIKGTPECCAEGAKKDPVTGFTEGSIRNRILGPYTD